MDGSKWEWATMMAPPMRAALGLKEL
jgi:hypothetical protein